jgi:hypothetical protein
MKYFLLRRKKVQKIDFGKAFLARNNLSKSAKNADYRKSRLHFE